MIIDNKENHHVVGVGFTAYAINVNIGVKTATKNAATIPLLIYPLYTSLNPYKLEYLKVLLGKKRLNNDYAYHE